MNLWVLSDFFCRDLVAVLVKFYEEAAERKIVVCYAYLPYDSEDPPPTKELEDLVRYCEKNICIYLWGDSNAHHSAWGSTNCNSRGEALMEFLSSSNLEFLNRGNQPTFCNAVREEELDVTLGFCGLLEKITDWEVSAEPSLSDHTHPVHSTGLHPGDPDQEP
jgi:hypothetical protein